MIFSVFLLRAGSGAFAFASSFLFVTPTLDRNIPMSTSQIAAALRDAPDAFHIRGNSMGSVETTSGFQSRRADSGNPIDYLKCFLAITPHSHRRPGAEATGITSRPSSCRWIPSRGRELSPDLKWQHAGCIDNISRASADVSQRVRSCEFPLYVTPESPMDLYDLRKLACVCRAEFRQ